MQINQIKEKVLESLGHILEYSFDYYDEDTKATVPMLVKIQGIIPLLIKTAHNFATSPNLPAMLIEDKNRDFIIYVLDILIKLAN